MTLTVDPNIRRNHVRRDDKSVAPETLLRDACLLLEAVGYPRGANWVSRVVRAYLASPIDGIPFRTFLLARAQLNERERKLLAERADLRYLLTYSDPTGEAAMRNVDRERGDGAIER